MEITTYNQHCSAPFSEPWSSTAAKFTRLKEPTTSSNQPHYVSWSEQKRIELHAQPHLPNIVRIITETGIRVYKELMSMKKDQLDLPNAVVWIPDSKIPNGIAEVPLTLLAVDVFRDQLSIVEDGPFLFPSDLNPPGHQVELNTVWQKSLRRAKVPYFRIYDLRST